MKLLDLKEAISKRVVFTTKEEIHAWLQDRSKCEIGNTYKIHDDLSVEFHGGFRLKEMVEYLPINIHSVGLDFRLDGNVKLKSLEGCPKKYVGGNFNINYCDLIKSLEHCTQDIGGTFSAAGCINLLSLEGGPQISNSHYNVSYCPKLKSLKGVPNKIDGDFSIQSCSKITSFEHFPKVIRGSVNIIESGIKSLVGIADFIDSIEKEIEFVPKFIKSGGLGLILIRNLQQIPTFKTGSTFVQTMGPGASFNKPNYHKAFKIIGKYLQLPDKIFECQQELIEAGQEVYAEL